MKCRFCNNQLTHEFIDLVNAPPSNSFLTKEQLNEPEVFYPLKLMVCEKCRLVQIDEYKKSDDIFNKDYAYFSSYSKSWLDHARKYADMITGSLELNAESHVIEIGSNDGYLLQYFKGKQIPCLGIEPSANTAQAAGEKGIETLEEFFGVDLAERLAQEGSKADLIIGNNVLAHVPDINDFVSGLKIALKPGGVVTMEFPHLMRLIEENQFDTIYHEHFSYLSFLIEQKKQGNKVAAYGAAAKGNTLFNYCGIKKDLISFVVDASPHKQGMFMPASHIPVVSEKNIKETRPDFVIILPWNIKDEITEQLSYIREWGGKFVVAVPDLKIV